MASNTSNLELLEGFLSDYYHIRYNIVLNEYEVKNLDYEKMWDLENETSERIYAKDAVWEELNDANLIRHMLKAHLKVPQREYETAMQSDYIERYNPINEYFENLPEWDGIDHIAKLTEYIEVSKGDQERFKTQFKNMFLRTTICALGGQLNKQAFVIVHEKQNSGKTTFLRWLVPEQLEDYYTENVELNKDGRIALGQNFIINIDEMSVLSKKDVNELKSVLSKAEIKDRLPYG